MGELIPIPDFAKELLRTQNCPFCKVGYTPKDVTAAGNRRGKSKTKAFFFYEVQCSACKSPSMTIMTSRPCDMYGLGVYISEMYAKMNEDGTDTRPKINYTKEVTSGPVTTAISDAEFSSAKRMIQNAATHDDFLKQIGLTDSDIKQMSSKRRGTQTDDED